MEITKYAHARYTIYTRDLSDLETWSLLSIPSSSCNSNSNHQPSKRRRRLTATALLLRDPRSAAVSSARAPASLLTAMGMLPDWGEAPPPPAKPRVPTHPGADMSRSSAGLCSLACLLQQSRAALEHSVTQMHEDKGGSATPSRGRHMTIV